MRCYKLSRWEGDAGKKIVGPKGGEQQREDKGRGWGRGSSLPFCYCIKKCHTLISFVLLFNIF